MIEGDDSAAGRAWNNVVADKRGAGARCDRYTNADKAVAHDVAGDGDIAQILAPARDHAKGRCVLDDIAADAGVRLDIDADAGIVVGRRTDRPLREQVA